jgi:hypothetical protein
MAQELTDKVTPNMPKFHLMCTWCGRRTESVKFSKRIFANVCQPKCPKTN